MSSASVAAGLRAAADLIEQHPDLPTPMVSAYTNGSVQVDWMIQKEDDQRDLMAMIRRTLGGTWDKVPAGEFFLLRQERDGITLDITTAREQVCERVVTGTETVTVPAVVAAPERTETREVVEWRCEPVLTEVSA